MLQASAPPASLTQQAVPAKPRLALDPVTSSTGFTFPATYSFPPFFTRQPHAATYAAQSTTWSQLILSYCRFHRVYRLELGPASLAPGAPRADLWSNAQISRKVDVSFQRELLDGMIAAGTASFDPPPSKSAPLPSAAFIYWRRPEEWGDLIYAWVVDRGLTNSIMTFFELSTGGDIDTTTEWHDMPYPLLRLSLATLIKTGRAQVFKGTEAGDEGDGVKFF